MNIINQLKKNVFSLILIQAINIISPIILIPLYIKYLSIEVYGLYALSLALSSFAQIIILYGFNFTANRAISVSKSKIEIQKIILSTRNTQFFLFLTCLFFFTFISYFFGKGDKFIVLVFLNILTFINHILYPQWLYHGFNEISTLKNISFINKIILTILAATLIPIFKIVELVPVIMIISTILTYLFLRFIKTLKPEFRFYLKFTTFKDILKELQNGYSLFISQLVSQVYVYSPKLILGLFLPLSSIALYDVSEKIIKIAKVPQYMLNQAFFPILSRDYNLKIKKIFEMRSLFFSIILVLILVFFSNSIFSVFIDDIQTNLVFFKIMSVSLIFIILSSYNGPLGLIILKKDSLWTKSTLFGLYSFLVLTTILIITDLVTLSNFAFVIVFSEMIVYLLSKKFLNNVRG